MYRGPHLPASTQANAEDPPLRGTVVLIGDSYTAGNGAGDYNGAQGSYQSPNNWVNRYVSWLNSQGMHATLTNLAFSGSTTAQVRSNQIPNVPTSADLVMMTIGGNDVHFATVVQQCFAVGARNPQACKMTIDAARAELGELKGNTQSVLSELQAHLSSDGAVSAGVVLTGYPHLSLDRPDYRLNRCTKRSALGICTEKESYAAATEVRKLADDAAVIQEQLVREWNARSSMKVTYASSVRTDFAGHEPDPSVLSRNDYRWLNEFTETNGYLGDDGKTKFSTSWDSNNWYHPNRIGHDQMAVAVREALGIPASMKEITSASGDIDVAFVIDTTGSMDPYIAAVKAQVK